MSRATLLHDTVVSPWYSLPPPSGRTEKRAIVIGAGLAGCSITHALDKQGWQVTLIDKGEIANDASGNRRGILKPHLTRTPGLLNQFNLLTYRSAIEKLRDLDTTDHPAEYKLCGVLQLLHSSGQWPDFDVGGPVSADTASTFAAYPVPGAALHYPEGGWVNAHSFCHSLINNTRQATIRTNTQVIDVRSGVQGWLVQLDGAAPDTLSTDVLIMATGPKLNQTTHTQDLTVGVSAGQTTRCRYRQNAPRPKKILTGKRFLVPDEEHCTIGASHWRDCLNLTPSAADDIHNLESMTALNPDLPAQLEPLDNWRALRATTPDRMPLVGAVPDFPFYQQAYAKLHHGHTHQPWPAARYQPGLYVMGGFGSRGIGTVTFCAGLLAEMINEQNVARASGQSFLPLIHPARFLIRQLKRGLKARTDTSRYN